MNASLDCFSIESINSYTSNNELVFHIININPNGFVLISADYLIRPVLAYSFNENYRDEELPVNIKYLFELYSRQLQEEKEVRNEAEEYIANDNDALNPNEFDASKMYAYNWDDYFKLDAKWGKNRFAFFTPEYFKIGFKVSEASLSNITSLFFSGSLKIIFDLRNTLIIVDRFFIIK